MDIVNNSTKVDVQSKTITVTNAIRNFVTQQTQRIWKHGGSVARVTVFLDLVKRKKNDSHAASAKVLVDLPGKNVVVEERSKNLYQAISSALKVATRKLGENKLREKEKKNGK